MFVTMTIANQVFGIPVLKVQDILGPQSIARVPLAPPGVLGSLNLRGRIVTAVDVRTRLGLPSLAETKKNMVVVECAGELYSLAVDKVGEVMSLSNADFERNPSTLDPRWAEVSSGIYRLEGNLLVVLDVSRLLQFDQSRAA
ncbi:MAG: chemotaxis protein CheW [Alphaproteobacteria bacterium]|nr:chemotaxis protein CheW [Alphaproteobacteria bacterium]